MTQITKTEWETRAWTYFPTLREALAQFDPEDFVCFSTMETAQCYKLSQDADLNLFAGHRTQPVRCFQADGWYEIWLNPEGEDHAVRQLYISIPVAL